MPFQFNVCLHYPEDANEAAEEAADGVEERAEGDEPVAPAKPAGFFGRLFGGGGGGGDGDVTATAAVAAAAAAEKPEEAAEEEPEKLGDASADADTDAGAGAGAGGDGDGDGDGGGDGDGDSDGGSDGDGGEQVAGKEEEEVEEDAKKDDGKRGKQPKNGKLRPKARDVKNIVLIGNGRSVLKKKLGAKVDEFDLVGRFNFFKLRKFEQNVGTRTDLWFIGELRQPGPVGHRARTVPIHVHTTRKPIP